MQIVWTAAALRDLAAIREFIAADNPRAADQQVQLILAGVATLLQFPQIGRPGRVIGTNELVIGRTPYLVPYKASRRNDRDRPGSARTAALAGSIVSQRTAARRHIPLEFARLRCYICAMMARCGWMLRITGPVLG